MRLFSSAPWIGAAVLAAALVAGPAQAQTAKPYEGKVVTILLPHGAAGPMTRYARMIAPYLQKYSGAKDIRFDNQPGAGGLKGTNNLYRAKPDGLTIGLTSISTLVFAQLAESPGAQFDVRKFTYLGRIASEPRVFTVGKASGITSFEDVIKLNRPFRYPSQGTDEDFYAMALLGDALDIDVKMITGYEGDPDTQLAIIKGDADGHISSFTSTGPTLKSGDKIAILTMDDKRAPEAPNTPAIMEVVKEGRNASMAKKIIEVESLHRAFFGPPGMDPVMADAMRAAIKQALADPALQAEAAKQDMNLSWADGPTEQKRIEEIMASSAEITPVLKKALDSIK